MPGSRCDYTDMCGRTLRIGIDLGGTKIEGLALDVDGAEVARRRIDTPGDYQETLSAIEGLVTSLEGENKGYETYLSIKAGREKWMEDAENPGDQPADPE